MHVFVVGNSGAGKSTFARALAEREGRLHVDLDPFAWAAEVGVRREWADATAAIREALGTRAAVVEGCYADLVEALIQPADRLVWLDPPLETCLARCRARPFEPHKWATAEDQDAFLPQLLAFVKTYPTRTDALGARAHRALFDAFVGAKERRTGT